MASGVALRESVKEMKRLKNEPLLMPVSYTHLTLPTIAPV